MMYALNFLHYRLRTLCNDYPSVKFICYIMNLVVIICDLVLYVVLGYKELRR